MVNVHEMVIIPSPLLDGEIVDKLFAYLPLKDIINQRRVCKLWGETGLQRLRRNIDQIKISFDPEKTIEKFLEMTKGFSFKFTNFSINYSNDGPNDDAKTQTDRLLKEYGTHIKVITLNLCGSTNSWIFLSDVLLNKARNVERMCLRSYQRRSETPVTLMWNKKPELKLKHLKVVWLNETIERTYPQTLLADLFVSSPYLESIKVDFGGEDAIDLATYVSQTLAAKGNISSLKKLALNVVDEDISKTLATSFKPAPLEEVCIQIYGADLSLLANIETFFGDHKDTLKDLNIAFPCVELGLKFTFPRMKNLKFLYLYGWWCHDESELHEHQLPFEVFDFGKLFPNLITLSLYEHSMAQGSRFFNLDEMLPENTTPVLTLKNLDLPAISNPAILRRMGHIFPNVLKFELVPRTPIVLKELWTTWPDIKTLHISILPYPSFRRINLDSVFAGVDGICHSRIFPSISHLRKLQHLRVDDGSHHSDNTKDLKITDETADLALAHMKQLVSLQISNNRHEISQSCVQHLCTELGMLESEAEVIELHLVKYEWQKLSSCPTSLDYK